MSTGSVSEVTTRVRYAETDQMGVAHHSAYLIWCEIGRTHYMRERGISYREIEEAGVQLPVAEAQLRFRAPARYDDPVRIRSWVRRCGSRLVEFGNAMDREEDGVLLATASIKLVAVSSTRTSIAIPEHVRAHLVPVEDPVRI